MRCLVEAWWAKEIIGRGSGDGVGGISDGGGPYKRVEQAQSLRRKCHTMKRQDEVNPRETYPNLICYLVLLAYCTLLPVAVSKPKVLGVHLRGTDKRSTVGGRVIEPKEHFPYVDNFLAEYGSDALVFVATDSTKFLEKMQRRYGDRIRHYEVGGGPSRHNIIIIVDKHRLTPQTCNDPLAWPPPSLRRKCIKRTTDFFFRFIWMYIQMLM